MKGSLVAGLFFTLIAHVSISNADIQAISGTALLYDPVGNPIGPPTPITGEYDTDLQQMTIHPWSFFGFFVNSQIEVLPPDKSKLTAAGWYIPSLQLNLEPVQRLRESLKRPEATT